jgi:ribosomal protein L10
MVPNRLARLALSDRGLTPPAGMLKGNVALSWGGPEAAIHAAKVVKDSPARKDGRLSYAGAVLEGNVLGPEDAASMADMPGKNELRSMILGCLSGPARGLVMCLAGNGAGLARVIQAHVDAAPAGPSHDEGPASTESES